MATLLLCCAAGATSLHQAGGGGDSGLVPALIGAVVGGALTLTGEYFTRRNSERKRFRQLRALLVEELQQISKRSRERDVALADADDIPSHGPLPSAAWQLMQASGGTDRLSAVSLQLLSDYYQGVADANYLATLVPNLVGVAAATKGPIGEAFLARARDFATTPYGMLASAGNEVLASLDGG
jgi:hypothetical protein